MAERLYPQTTLYHLLAAYGDVLHRTAERNKERDLYQLKLPPQTIGMRDG